MRWTPRAGPATAFSPPIMVGFLRLTDATNSTNAGTMTKTRIQRSQADAYQSGITGALFQPTISKPMAAIESSENSPRNGCSPMRATTRSRRRVPETPK